MNKFIYLTALATLSASVATSAIAGPPTAPGSSGLTKAGQHNGKVGFSGEIFANRCENAGAGNGGEFGCVSGADGDPGNSTDNNNAPEPDEDGGGDPGGGA